MFSIIFGTILPALVWILMIPLKLALKVVKQAIRLSIKVASEAVSKVDKKLSENNKGYEVVTNTGKTAVKLGKNTYQTSVKTAKLTKKLVRYSYKLAKFGIRVLIKVLEILIILLDWIVTSIVLIANSVGIIYTVLIVGAIVSVVIVISSASSYSIVASDFDTLRPSQEQERESVSHITSDSFLAIDWSGDFTSSLDRIEATYTMEAANWVELTVIQMNTMQRMLEDGEIQIGISGFMTGLKAVESGQNSLATKRDIANQEVYYGNGTARRNTPMQFDTKWEVYNPYYPNYSRSSEGSPFYYPDAFYGVYQRFNKSSIEGYRPERTNPLYERAFSDMGVAMTDEKIRFVRYLTNITNEYNAVFLENHSAMKGKGTAEDMNDTVYANAMLMIQFAEIYGYNTNGKTVDLAKSLYKNHHKDEQVDFSMWYYNRHELAQQIYGMGVGGGKNYPADLDSTSDFGVIDKNGNPVSGSLFSYLLSEMPDNARQNMLNSSGLRVYNAHTSHYWRSRYDLTAYLAGVYDLWWASKELGVIQN